MKHTINPLTWFAQRKVGVCPDHFVTTKAQLTPESTLWIEERLLGRWHELIMFDAINATFTKAPAFEDPQEAILYELTWS